MPPNITPSQPQVGSGVEALRSFLLCAKVAKFTHEELTRIVERECPGRSVGSGRTKLIYVRWWWALTAYRVVTKEPSPSMAQVRRFVAKLAGGVSQAEMKEVLEGKAHLSAESLASLEKGLGINAEFHRATVMGESFEEGIRDFDYRRECDRKDAELRRKQPRRRLSD